MKNDPQRNMPFFDRVKNIKPTQPQHTLNEIFSNAMWAESLRTHTMIPYSPDRYGLCAWGIPDTFLNALDNVSRDLSLLATARHLPDFAPDHIKQMCYDAAMRN